MLPAVDDKDALGNEGRKPRHPDDDAAPAAAAWLRNPTTPPPTAAQRLEEWIKAMETEPEWTGDEDTQCSDQ